LDGLYARPFFTYIDNEGTAHRPLLPAQNSPVEDYNDLMWTYNLLELIQDKAQAHTPAVMES